MSAELSLANAYCCFVFGPLLLGIGVGLLTAGIFEYRHAEAANAYERAQKSENRRNARQDKEANRQLIASLINVESRNTRAQVLRKIEEVIEDGSSAAKPDPKREEVLKTLKELKALLVEKPPVHQ